MTKRAEQKEKRRNEILLAGLNLFVHKGYAATKIADLADKVGMSVGLLYKYFSSTEVLYEELINIALSARTGQYFPEYDTPLAYFENSARHIFNQVKNDPYIAEYFVLINQARHNPNLPQGIKDKLEQNNVLEKSVRLIQEGQLQGTVRKGNSQALALAFWLSVQAYVEMIALEPETPFPDTDWFIDIIKS